MKIKKDNYHVIFFILFFEIICIALITLGFFLGFELSEKNLLIYLIINLVTILLGVFVYLFYLLICKTYYEFNNEAILVIKKGIIKQIEYKQIKYCEYHRFINLVFGDPKGGNLLICYIENGIEKNIEISFLKKLIKKVSIKNIGIKWSYMINFIIKFLTNNL